MLGWMKNIRELPAQTLLLLEECQIGWIGEEYNRREFAMVFRSHPDIAWYFSHKCPAKAKWVDGVQAEFAAEPNPDDAELRRCVGAVLAGMEDWIVYAVDPDIYQNQSFVGWDGRELTDLIPRAGLRAVDIGSGTGKQAFLLAETCAEVYCVEPVANLRKYLRARAEREGKKNVRVIDGYLENLPLEDGFADIVTGGHVFGDFMDREYAELLRVCKPGGVVILIPGNNDKDNEAHRFLTERGFRWSRFEEPGDGFKRKYWKTK